MAGDFTTSRSFIYVAGNVIVASQNNTNENNIYTAHNNAFNETTGHQHTGATGDAPPISIVGVFEALRSIVPVGTIFAHWDNNGAISIDTDYLVYCDGQTISDATSPYNGVTIPDMSNRYLVGFGTEGGGDNGTAAWPAGPITPDSNAVGNASHQIDIQHSHTMNAHSHVMDHGHADTFSVDNESSHTHDLSNHTHTAPAHVHTVAIYDPSVAKWLGNFDNDDSFNDIIMGHDGAAGSYSTSSGGPFDTIFPASATGLTAFTSTDGGTATSTPSTNTSGSGSAHNHGLSGGVTNFSGSTQNETSTSQNALSTTQSIQPRSVLIRWVMRKK